MKTLTSESRILQGLYTIDRWTLRFKDVEAEAAFRETLISIVIPLTRIALVLAFGMYSVFVFLDYRLFPQTFMAQTVLRGIGSLSILVTLLVTFLPVYRRRQELVISVPILICAYIHFVMLFVSNLPSDYARSATGLMLLYTYYFGGLRFIVSSRIVGALLAGYVISAFGSGKVDLFTFFYQSFWLFSQVVICVLSVYAIEYMVRRSYVQGILIREMESAEFRRQLAAQEKMAAVGDMAAGIVHDLKNPVGIIKGSVELADDDAVSREERRELLRIVNQEADRMLSLVQDLLEFSRGSVSIQKQSIESAVYMERVKAIIAPVFDAKDLSVSIESNYTGPMLLDPDRFLRVLVNIAGNAADALQPGGEFKLALARQSGHLLFTLADNGPGIPESIRDTLFQPFVTHGKAHGTGLGMAIVKSMVEAHGGRISFETETGKGTTFTIEVPA